MNKILKFTSSSGIIALLTISFLAIFFQPDSQYHFYRLFLFLLTSISAEYISTNLFKNRFGFRMQNISIPFFIFLITDPQINIFLPIFAVILSHLSYYFLVYNEKPIFNSAALGIFLLSLFGLKITWWGISSGILIIIATVVFGLLKSIKERSIRIVGIYLLSVIIISLLFSFNPLYSIKQIFIPGFIFFCLFILTQNISLILYNIRTSILYVVSASVIAITFPKLGVFTDPLITSIVFTDLGFIIFRVYYFKEKIANN